MEHGWGDATPGGTPVPVVRPIERGDVDVVPPSFLRER
jgi:hypothetical protein